MTDIEVLEREKQCVQRKTAINCSDCAHCDLLMDDAVILAAYDKVISALSAKRVQKVNDLYDEDGKEIYEENRESSTMFTLDEAIQHCYKVVERLRKSNPCDTCAAKHEQLAHWLEELKKLRVECDELRSNWYKCAEKVKTLRAERDAAVSDLRKLVPAWKWDGEKEQSSHKEAPECGCVEFG